MKNDFCHRKEDTCHKKADSCCFFQGTIAAIVALALTIAAIAATIAAIVIIIISLGIPTSPAQLTGIQAQLTDAGNTIVTDTSNIIFDEVLNDESAAVAYNAATGEFTISEAGNYYVSWWVATDGSTATSTANFSLAINGVPQSTASTPIISGQVSGSAFITVDTVPVTLTIQNTSADDVLIANTTVQANINIITVSQ